MKIKRALLILDRDGVINEKPKRNHRYILDQSDLVLRESVLLEISKIQSRGIEVAVASNQQCLGKGLISINNMNQMNGHINLQIVKHGGIKMDFYICGHLESENCKCRKPKPGLLNAAIEDSGIENRERNCMFVGDSMSDEQAAKSAGVLFSMVHDENSTANLLESIFLSKFGLMSKR